MPEGFWLTFIAILPAAAILVTTAVAFALTDRDDRQQVQIDELREAVSILLKDRRYVPENWTEEP